MRISGQSGRPLRLYLDQKDFGRMAKALLDGDEASPDYVAYRRLTALVSRGAVRVYFSHVHVVEALRFPDGRSPIAVRYCAVLDTLTQGHCIRHPGYLQRSELELALAEIFGFA